MYQSKSTSHTLTYTIAFLSTLLLHPTALAQWIPIEGMACDSPHPLFPRSVLKMPGEISATTTLEIEISPTGTVDSVSIKVGSRIDDIDLAAMTAARQMKCTFATPPENSVKVNQTFVFKKD